MAIVNIGIATTELIAPAARKKLIISNIGENRVWIIKKTAASLNEGFPLDPGEKIILDASGYDLNDNWNAIAETAATNISVYEVR